METQKITPRFKAIFTKVFFFFSYTNMSVIVDQLYPSRLEAANEYSQNVYWRDPIQTLEELPELPEI